MYNITTMKELVIKNRRICDFYENNPTLNFEAVNLIFIDLFDKLLQDTNATINSSINSQILFNVNENTTKINELNTSVSSLKESIGNIQADITSTLIERFMNIKSSYVDDLKHIIQENTNDKIGSLLEKNNNILIDKTNLILNDVVPKSQSQCYLQIQDSIRSFHKSISDDTRVLLKYVDNNTIKDYINSFEMKSSMMMQNIQQPIYSFISASEERINTNISSMKSNSTISTKLIGELTDFLQNSKFIHSSFVTKENISIILNKIYSTSEIQLLHNTHSSNTFCLRTQDIDSNKSYIIKRHNKQKVLLHSAEFDRNINNEEIRHFTQTVEENNCHGIFISQNSGFTSKPNFHIETHNKLIMVYVHTANYSPEKITAAVDIIDNLYEKFREFNIDNSFEISIDKEVLDEINKEYQLFITQKEAMILVLKETQKKVFLQIEEFKFPALDKYLSTKFAAVTHKQGLKCDLCKIFNAHNLKALAAHKRGCNRKILVNAVISAS